MTISGSDFQSGSTVTFGDSTATDIVVISSGTITAVTPAHPAGTVDVIVTNPSGLSDTLSSGLTFLSHPDVTFINPSSGTELGGTSVTIVGSNFQSGSTVTFGDSTATDIVVISSGTITAVTPAHPAGTVDVIVTNPNGLSDTLSNRFEFIGIPPVVTSIDPNSGTQLGSTSVTISGNSFQSGSTVTFGDSTATDIVVVSSAIVTAKTSSYPAGTVDVIVTNPNGLADTLSNGFIFIPPLVVTSINPNSDTQLGGTSVTISGSDFQSGSTVTFGDSTATDIVVISSGTITAVTPAHPAGTVDVIVTNPSGLSDTLSSGLTFLSHPEVTFINPSSGTELGGTSVTIVGSNFQSGSTVTFGDSTATDIVVISSGTITAVTPAHPAGTVDVIVTNPNGLSDTLSNRFEFIGIPPVVTSIDPNSGTQLGSTSVTISGNSFQSGSTVTFGDSTATDIVVVSSAIVTAKTSSYPAGTVDVIVTNPNGLADTLSNGFIFIPPLVVTSINPNSDTQLGGTSVTISGSDFQSGSTVTFGDSTATDIVVISSGTITAVTPAHPAGTVDVIVTNPSGLSDTLSSGLTFLSHPEVTFINPSSGTELGGTSVTIVGGNFQSGLTVTFGDSSATDIVVVSSTIITAKTSLYPAGTVDVIVTNPSGLSDTLSNGFIFLSHPVPTIAVSPTAIDFDTVKIGNLASDTLIVINTGTVSLRLDSLVVSGNPVFSSPSGPFSIAPGESLEVEVTFIPDTAKIFSDTLTIFSNSNNDSSLDMSLTGTGGGFPAIDAVPDTLNFGDIVVNTSKTDTVVVKSVGSILALEIDSVVVTSGDSVYSIVGIVGIGDSIIAFGDSFKISVEYSPKDVGSDEGTLTIFSNALRVPAVSVVLLGSAEGFANIDVDPDTLDFGNLRFGLSKRDTVGIISVGVGTSLVIDSLVVTEGTTFVLIDTVGNTFLLVGDTLFAVIEYTPDGMDTNRAKLNIFSNTINNLVLGVPLEGKGIAPYIDASTLAIEFDSVEVGNTSEGLVVIRNSGDAGLTLGILTVDDVVNYAFNLPLVSVSDSVIAPGDSITVVVTFQPEERGTFPAILTIPSNDPDALQDTVFVNLTGVGIAPVNEVSRSLIDFLGMPKDSVKVDSVFVKNVGDTPAKILSVEIGTSIFTPSFGDSVINPSDSVRVDVAFRPPSAGLFEDTLIVVNGIPSSSETLKVALVGRGILINVLAVGDAQAFAGDMDVEVSLSILNNDTLRGVEFDLIFDADSLTLVDVKPRFGLAASLTPPYGVILDIPQGTNLVPIHQDLDTLAVLVFDVDAGVPAGIVGLDLENVKFTGASGDTLTPDSVALDGSIEILFGMNIDVGPDTMVFAESPPNDTSFAALRVFNVGNRDSLIVAQIISSNPSVFSVVDPLPSSPILKVDSLDITLRFTSPDTGFFTATATIVSNDLDADSVFVVNLTGVGKIAGFNISSSVKYFADTTKNVPDVVIRLAELPDQTFVDSDTAITDGSYDLLLVPAGKGYRATPLRAETEGAATGAITINDPVFLLQKLGGIRSFNRQDTLAADVDGDLVPTINDAVFLLQKLGGIRSLVKQLCPRQRLKRRLWVKE